MIGKLPSIALAAVGVLLASGCTDERPVASPAADGRPSGRLIVFHAGSLSVPFREIAEVFSRAYPDVEVVREAGGSRRCARKISDLGRACDVMASADYTVIDALLIPDHAEWLIKFATNEMVLVYGDRSRLADRIGSDNWHEVLLGGRVAVGRSDPNLDPCGYRTLLTLKLAEKHYGAAGLTQRICGKDRRYIRPKETDLLALLELGEIDCAFLYRSLALQHGLRYVPLPDEINLASPAMSDLYGTVSVRISGTRPGSFITKTGGPMVYGVTIPTAAPNRAAAVAFLEFLLDEDKGMAIMRRCGQASVVPASTETFARVPQPLKRFAREAR